MGDYMITLYKDRKLAKQLGEKGKQIVNDQFSLKSHLEIVESLINKAIKNYPS